MACTGRSASRVQDDKLEDLRKRYMVVVHKLKEMEAELSFARPEDAERIDALQRQVAEHQSRIARLVKIIEQQKVQLARYVELADAFQNAESVLAPLLNQPPQQAPADTEGAWREGSGSSTTLPPVGNGSVRASSGRSGSFSAAPQSPWTQPGLGGDTPGAQTRSRDAQGSKRGSVKGDDALPIASPKGGRVAATRSPSLRPKSQPSFGGKG